MLTTRQYQCHDEQHDQSDVIDDVIRPNPLGLGLGLGLGVEVVVVVVVVVVVGHVELLISTKILNVNNLSVYNTV